jgi:AcrR family transcriptional regulator
MDEPKKNPRGRPPRDEESVRQALLSSCMNLLLERGYEAVTMEGIAAHAGVAKKTVYRYAANRQELVGQAVRQWSDGYAASMHAEPVDGDDVVHTLRRILESICMRALSETAIRVFRVLTSEFPGKQELMDSYLQNGIERGRAMLAEWLRKQHEKGLLHAPEPALMANAILAMAVAEPLRQMAIGITRPIPEGSVAAHLDACMIVLSRLVVADGKRHRGDGA